MSYTKQTWATGDTITAAKLNHMEDGIAGALDIDLLVRVDVEDGDPTFTVAYGNATDVLSKMAQGVGVRGAVEQNVYEEGTIVMSESYLGDISKDQNSATLIVSTFNPNVEDGDFLSLSATKMLFQISGTTIVNATVHTGTKVF